MGKIKIVRASDALADLVRRKDPADLAELADVYHDGEDDSQFDAFEAGLRIGEEMIRCGEDTLVVCPDGQDEGGAYGFIGRPRDVRKEVAALEDLP